MKYFNTLPLVSKLDKNENIYQLTNLVNRVEFLPQLSRNPMLFYQYTIQDGDTPESIAEKYYDDAYRYWIVLLANNIQDPQTDWPLRTEQFQIYLNDKYQSAANTANQNVNEYLVTTVHHYEKQVVSTDNVSATKSVKTIIIDEDTYNTLVPSIQTYSFPDGSSSTVEVKKEAVSIYDYEFTVNEDKRLINLVQSRYISDVEKTFESLMSD